MSRQPSPTPSLAHSTTTTGSWPLASSTEHARSPAEPLTPLDAAFEVPALVIALPSLMIEAKGPRRPWEDVTHGSEERETQVLRQAKVQATTRPAQSKSFLLRPIVAPGLATIARPAARPTGAPRPSIAISRRSQSLPPVLSSSGASPSPSAISIPMQRHAGPYALFAHRRAVSYSGLLSSPTEPGETRTTLVLKTGSSAHGPPPPYSARPKRKYLLVGPAIARHLRNGGGVRVRDNQGSVLAWLNSVEAGPTA